MNTSGILKLSKCLANNVLCRQTTNNVATACRHWRFFSCSVIQNKFCRAYEPCHTKLYMKNQKMQASFALPMESGQGQMHRPEGTSHEKISGLRHTVWDQQDLKPTFPKLERDEKADVAIIGGGIAGLSVAYNLVKEGKNVVLLESQVIGCGQTGRTTAHIMAWYDDFYSHIEKDHGLEIARLVANSHMKAIDFIEATVKEEGIDCHFCKLDGYLFPHDDSPEATDELLKEFEACKRVGLDIKIVDLGHDPAHGKIGKAIQFPNSAEFHPLLYIQGLANAIKKRGGRIYEMSRASKTEMNEVGTDGGAKVSANAVVHATNSPLNHNLAIHARQTAYRTYAIGLKVPKGSVKRANWWDTKDSYHYVRIEEKPDHDVLIVGGEDTSSGMNPSDYPADPYANLEKWAKQRWTMAGETVYKWTGQWYDPVDSLYHIGLNPVQHDHYLISGDSGQGMTSGTIGGILIKDMIMGIQNAWMKAYDPARTPPLSMSTGQKVATETSHTVHGYKDRLPGMGTDAIDIEDLKPNCGAVINKGLEKIAVYKDENGTVHKFSAVCPHMKATVKWNPIDKTFDCGVHGSIFDSCGRCINGPATSDLESKD